MTQQLSPALAALFTQDPGRSFVLSDHYVSAHQRAADVTPTHLLCSGRRALDEVQDYLDYSDLTLADLAPLLGGLLAGTPASVVLRDAYPRASCDCCNDHHVVTLHLV